MQQRALISLALVLISCSVSYACHGKLIATGITEEERSIILQEHNRLRQIVATGRYPGQPGAENMREIIWDDELAARAQQWADNCQFRHDPHRTINRFTMGQNLAIIWSTAPLEADDGDFPSRIQSWFNEVQKYSFGDAWSPKTGHYSQLVWGETSLVGCGFSEYKDASKYNKLYVCNYGPGGNVVGYNPYEVGKPSCSTYGMKPSARYQGLCAAPGASVNSVFGSNTIETYEYSYNAALSSKSNKNNNNNKATNNINKSLIQSYINQKNNNPSSPSKHSSPTYPQQASSTPSTGGSSFGTASRGGSHAYTTESNQQPGKYRHKLETYRPSAAEFEKSVHKHTILRTYIEQNRQGTGDEQQQKQGTAAAAAESTESLSTTTPAAKRGWSLLTWRG
ncbi:cysteine-rich venom protein latisemin [Scaptodrosophila lebanonensis]|uniref:Cysteine-rich venom protein latisemin n=1 Tax=Drosophila lebanonensis TaxID=7225 RepID=A0A6J2T4T4_DROLE|nr:cysteine-rich venom protein latisemin [Scaptodrosophila lebanonensis]